MATVDTVDLGPPHPPKEESIKLFHQLEHELKKQLVHLRHDHDKHEPEYFAAVSHLSDHELASFSADDLELVRVAVSAYGYHLFGKLRLPALPGAYVHFRAFTDGPDAEEPPKLHSFHTEEKVMPDGDRKYRAILTKDDPLEWFDT